MRVYFTLAFSLLAQRQFTEQTQNYSPVRFHDTAHRFHSEPRRNTLSATQFGYNKKKHLLITDLKCTSSLRSTDRFWRVSTPSDTLPMVSPVLPSTPLLGFTGWTLITTTDSSATSHPHKPWLSPCAYASDILPEQVSGFPSYCTGSLQQTPPSNTQQV